MHWRTWFHTCQTPDPITLAPIEGRRWVCPKCKATWVYETRIIQVEVSPAVWDQWADVQDEPITAWYKEG